MTWTDSHAKEVKTPSDSGGRIAVTRDAISVARVQLPRGSNRTPRAGKAG